MVPASTGCPFEKPDCLKMPHICAGITLRHAAKDNAGERAAADLRDDEALAALRIVHGHVQARAEEVLVVGGHHMRRHKRACANPSRAQYSQSLECSSTSRGLCDPHRQPYKVGSCRVRDNAVLCQTDAAQLTVLWVGAICRRCERCGHLSCQLDLVLNGTVLAAGATKDVRRNGLITAGRNALSCANS